MDMVHLIIIFLMARLPLVCFRTDFHLGLKDEFNKHELHIYLNNMLIILTIFSLLKFGRSRVGTYISDL